MIKKTIIMFVLIFTVSIFLYNCIEKPSQDNEGETTQPPIISGNLENRLKHTNTIMWIAAHPDDELYTGGTFGYYTRDLNGKLVLVSLYYNPKFVDSNEESAKFLGNANYIRIQEQLGIREMPRCRKWDQLNETVTELENIGVKDYIKQLILDYKPDIVFGFESTNGFRHSCQHVSMAKLVDKAVKELWSEGYKFFEYYYILNRDPGWFGTENMDPPPVTDTINLDDKMWSYKLTLFDIYSEFYPKLKNEIFINGLQHKEYFRRIRVNISSIFPSGIYSNNPTDEALSKDFVKGSLVSIRWRNIETQQGKYDWSTLDSKINKISQAGKVAVLNIMATGVNAPDWLINDPEVETFSFVDENPNHSTYGDTLTAPLYWDEKYLEEKKRFIEDLGKRYANDPAVVGVMVSFVTQTGNDWSIPSNAYDELLDKGYTTEKMFNAGKETIDAWAEAFPKQVLKLPIGKSIPDNGNTITTLAERILNYGYSKYPDRFFAQINALCTKIPCANSPEVQNALPDNILYLLKLLSEHPEHIGLQMLCDATAHSERLDKGNKCENHEPECILTTTLDIALSYKPYYIEFWHEDLENPEFEEILRNLDNE